jgi:hypothetical protein
MHKLTRIVPPLFSFVLMFAVGICLASPAAAAQATTTKINTETTKSSPAISKSTAQPMSKVIAKKRSDVLASAEDLSGTITVVDPSDKEITLVGSNGVPYDFDLTTKTRVELSDNTIGVNQLATETHKQATVHFVPTSHGNLADSIQISGS